MTAASFAGFLPGTAAAHEILPGVTGFPSILLHPFVSVETALLILGLTLVVGAAEHWRAVLSAGVAIVIGTSAGVALQPIIVVVPGVWRLPLSIAFVVGILAATGHSFGSMRLFIIAAIVSALVGMAVPPERPGAVGRLEVIAAVATAIAAAMLLISVPRFHLAHYRTVVLAARIVGAWICSISLLGMAIWLR